MGQAEPSPSSGDEVEVAIFVVSIKIISYTTQSINHSPTPPISDKRNLGNATAKAKVTLLLESRAYTTSFWIYLWSNYNVSFED